MKIHIINGPNLNLLGKREPEVYGNQPFENFLTGLLAKFPQHHFTFFQSNIEGELINALQEAGDKADGIILNPAGYTHTSVAIGDCIAAIPVPVIEVHISNIFSREEFRKHSYVSAKAKAVITGMGLFGYEAAVSFLEASAK